MIIEEFHKSIQVYLYDLYIYLQISTWETHIHWNIWLFKHNIYVYMTPTIYIAQLAGAVEYIDCFSAEG